MKIESVAVLTRYFIKKFRTYHEILYICTSNEKNKYFFIAHRGMRKNIELHTSVKLNYYKKEDLSYDCDDGSPEKIDPNNTLIEKQSGEYLCESQKSFRNLVEKFVNYTENHPIYKLFSDNCQHFATGASNEITGGEKRTQNINKNRVPKPNFEKPGYIRTLAEKIEESDNKDTILFVSSFKPDFKKPNQAKGDEDEVDEDDDEALLRSEIKEEDL